MMSNIEITIPMKTDSKGTSFSNYVSFNISEDLLWNIAKEGYISNERWESLTNSGDMKVLHKDSNGATIKSLTEEELNHIRLYLENGFFFVGATMSLTPFANYIKDESIRRFAKFQF